MENPYWLALTSPEPGYVFRIALFTGLFAGVSKLVERVVARAKQDAGQLQAALASLSEPRKSGREGRSGSNAASTTISSIHAVGTSLSAVWVVLALQFWARGDPDGSISRLWSWTLAFSQGYFIADGLCFGLDENGATWVLIHHAWMTIAHHPIGELTRGCALMGLGDCSRAVWLSSVGYLSEVSTVFLNIRWLQHQWLQEHNIWYSVNSSIILLTYPSARVLAVPCLLAGSLWPHWQRYRQNGLGSLVIFTSVTYSALMLMSSYFFYTLVRRGLSRALTFQPSSDKKE